MKKPLSLSSMPPSMNQGADADGDAAADAGAIVNPVPAKPAPVDPYQSKADMRTLMEAQKIKADKGRHGRAIAAAREHVAHLKQITKGE